MYIYEQVLGTIFGVGQIILGKAIETIFIIVLGLIAVNAVASIVQKALVKSKLDVSLHKFVINIVKGLIYIVVLMSVCGVFGINTTSFVAVLGAAGAAIALALKDSLANIAGGIIIIITKPFKNGDYIDLGDTAGVVQEIDLFSTTLKTFDNQVISVPNGKISTSVIKNATVEATRRVDLIFSISYGDDFDKAKSALLKLAQSNSNIFADPEPFVGVASYGESSVNLDFRVWCATENYFDVRYYITDNVKKYFDEEGVSIPFPHLEIINKKSI